MRRTLLFPLLPLILAQPSITASAQTYFYLSTISVDPGAPTTTDAITISLSGDLSSTGSEITGASWMLMGSTVHITLTAASGPGLDVLVPHTEDIDIGMLPAGSYSILVDGAFIDDSAPEFQHSFNVVGTGGPDCEGLTIASVQWSTLSDTTLSVHVFNSGIGFDYPGFILLDADGDTLAQEVVDFFAIGEESWHTLQIPSGTVMPDGTFTGTLQLWTGFFSELACSWVVTLDLCPATECSSITPYLGNFGGALAIGNFSWSIADDGGEVASGVFTLTNELQMATAEACLPPGSYTYTLTPLQEPMGGQLVIGVNADGWTSSVQQPFPQGFPADPLAFDVVPACSDAPNAIEPEQPALQQVVVATRPSSMELRATDGKRLGPVSVHDLVGRTVHQELVLMDRVQIPVPTTGVYLVSARDRVMKVTVAAP